MPLSVNVDAGIPCVAMVCRKVASTIGLVTAVCALACSALREQSSSQDKISLSAPVLSR